ncbi:MAG TPA: M3 family metallopeptidase [Candidatus Saccharimonadales bacterium]|nr:M3 family metallopeptidase [Candidatus Saccharimonadales bacterium]
MKKYFLYLVALVALSSGCGKKKVVQERICSRIDSDRIVSLFPKTVADVQALVEKSKNELNTTIEMIGDISGMCRTYHNTMVAYDQAYFHFLLTMQVLQVLAVASCDAQLQSQAQHALSDLQEYKDNVLTRNVTLYQAFKEYERFGQDTYRRTASVNYFLYDILHRFEKNGMHLPLASRMDLVELQQEIKDLQHRYCNNIQYDSSSIAVPPKELYGLSDEALQNLSKDKDGNYILPMNPEIYSMVMQHCLVESTRKSYFMLFARQAYCTNQFILEELIHKQNELAEKLQYKDFATYQLSDLIVKTPQRTEDFLWKMVKILQAYEDKEFKELTKHLPPSVHLVETNQLKPWDKDLVKAWYKDKHFNNNNDEISQYFSLENVICAFLQKCGQFFHLEFQPEKIENIWAPDVLCYRVRSLRSQAIIGYLFLDVYQRPCKKISQQCCMMIIPAIRDDCSTSCIGSSVIMANFAKPTQDKPTLLKLNEAISLFHEMGHAIHNLFGATRFTQFSGTQVSADFFQIPSRMLDYWFDDPEFIHAISRHYKTGNHLSRDMIEKIIASRKFDRIDDMLQQLFLALVSLTIFKQPDQKINMHTMIEKIYKKVFKHTAYEFNCYFETNCMSLAHCGAAYYIYPWSAMIAADLFAHIKKQGIDDYRTGATYVSEILSHGGSKPSQDMIKRYLGRSWNSHAFFESL